MYGKLNERKIHENDYILSCEKAREELSEYINEEARRVNVDSAKKRAVVQHMDYEGFRQMVLGANIFPTKSKELYSFSKGQTSNIPTNMKQEEITDPEKIKQKPKKTIEQTIILQKITGKSELHCNSFREFKKKFTENYPKEADNARTEYCYNLIKEQNEERLRRIFNTECQGNILVKICNIFDQVMTQMLARKEEEGKAEGEVGYMLMFFKILMSIPTMKDVTLAILTKKERNFIGEFLGKIKNVLKQQEDGIEIEKIRSAIVK